MRAGGLPDGLWRFGGDLAGDPPRFSPSCGKVRPRMGKYIARERGTRRQAACSVPNRNQSVKRLIDLRAENRRFKTLTVFLVKTIYEISSFRRPMQVREYILHCDTFGFESAYYLCPRCDVTMERDYQAYCDRCGQCLSWNRSCQAKRRSRL